MRLISISLCLFLTISTHASASPALLETASNAWDAGESFKAIDIWRALASEGHPKAQQKLGFAYSVGIGVEQNWRTAIKWWELAAAQKQPSAIKSLRWARNEIKANRIILNFNNSANRKKFDLALKEARDGNAAAQQDVGWMYLKGIGTPFNGEEAVKWLRRSADQNHALAMLSLVDIYIDGAIIKRDFSKALDLLRNFANQDIWHAQFAQRKLGWMHLRGIGVPKNRTKAKEWYERAAKWHDSSTYLRISSDYLTSIYISETPFKEFQLAISWMKRAETELGTSIKEELSNDKNTMLLFCFNFLLKKRPVPNQCKPFLKTIGK